MGTQCCTPQKNEQQLITQPSKRKIVKSDEECKQGQNSEDSDNLVWNQLCLKEMRKIKPSKQAFIGEFSPAIEIHKYSEQSICSFDEFSMIPMSDIQLISTIQDRDTPIFDKQRNQTQKPLIKKSVSDDEQKKKKGKYDQRTMNDELRKQKQRINKEMSLKKFQNPSTSCGEKNCKNVTNLKISVSCNVIPILKTSQRRRSKSMTPITKKVRFIDSLAQHRFVINQQR